MPSQHAAANVSPHQTLLFMIAPLGRVSPANIAVELLPGFSVSRNGDRSGAIWSY